MESNKRQGDIFGRLGGDEFGFILHGSSQADALNTFVRMKDALETMAIESPIGDFYISFCVGVTEIQQGDTSPDDLLHRADLALYHAKGQRQDRPG
jgi:diguanylate cyclase (GGDEF)-like protein